MKYYNLLTINYKDGSKDKVSVYTFETESEAIASFHSELGKAMKDQNVSHVLCVALNSEGGIYKNETWTAAVEE